MVAVSLSSCHINQACITKWTHLKSEWDNKYLFI